MFSEISIPRSQDGAVHGCLAVMFGYTGRHPGGLRWVTPLPGCNRQLGPEVWKELCSAPEEGPTENVFPLAAKGVQAADHHDGPVLPGHHWVNRHPLQSWAAQSIHDSRALRRVKRIMAGPSHPGHSLLSRLPSKRRLRLPMMTREHHRDSFSPSAAKLMNVSGNPPSTLPQHLDITWHICTHHILSYTLVLLWSSLVWCVFVYLFIYLDLIWCLFVSLQCTWQHQKQVPIMFTWKGNKVIWIFETFSHLQINCFCLLI